MQVKKSGVDLVDAGGGADEDANYERVEDNAERVLPIRLITLFLDPRSWREDPNKKVKCLKAQ